jgi:hypothetical protein
MTAGDPEESRRHPSRHGRRQRSPRRATAGPRDPRPTRSSGRGRHPRQTALQPLREVSHVGVAVPRLARRRARSRAFIPCHDPWRVHRCTRSCGCLLVTSPPPTPRQRPSGLLQCVWPGQGLLGGPAGSAQIIGTPRAGGPEANARRGSTVLIRPGMAPHGVSLAELAYLPARKAAGLALRAPGSGYGAHREAPTSPTRTTTVR